MKAIRMASEEFFEDDVMLVAMPSWENQKRQQLEERGILFLNGEIDCAPAGAIIRAINNIIYIKRLSRIIFFINSEGGSLWDGWAIHDALELASAKGIQIVTVALGKVQSAATIVYLAGDIRITSPNAIFTIHEASTWLSGKVSEQKDYLKFLSDCEERYLKLVTSKSNITRRMLKQRAYRKDWYFTAEEALKLRFATHSLSDGLEFLG